VFVLSVLHIYITIQHVCLTNRQLSPLQQSECFDTRHFTLNTCISVDHDCTKNKTATFKIYTCSKPIYIINVFTKQTDWNIYGKKFKTYAITLYEDSGGQYHMV